MFFDVGENKCKANKVLIEALREMVCQTLDSYAAQFVPIWKQPIQQDSVIRLSLSDNDVETSDIATLLSLSDPDLQVNENSVHLSDLDFEDDEPDTIVDDFAWANYNPLFGHPSNDLFVGRPSQVSLPHYSYL
jgi:hypothetical protein